MAGLAAARQDWQLARKHYEQILRSYPSLPAGDRHEHLRSASVRRQTAFERYMGEMLADHSY